MEKNCGNCANYDREKEAHTGICGKCVVAYVEGVAQEPSQWRALPQTNADRIRAMSDEELAKWYASSVVVSSAMMLSHFGVVLSEEEMREGANELEKIFIEGLKKPVED